MLFSRASLHKVAQLAISIALGFQLLVRWPTKASPDAFVGISSPKNIKRSNFLLIMFDDLRPELSI